MTCSYFILISDSNTFCLYVIIFGVKWTFSRQAIILSAYSFNFRVGLFIGLLFHSLTFLLFDLFLCRTLFLSPIFSGIKPFTCPICGRGFTQKEGVQRHVKLRHANLTVDWINFLLLPHIKNRNMISVSVSIPLTRKYLLNVLKSCYLYSK